MVPEVVTQNITRLIGQFFLSENWKLSLEFLVSQLAFFQNKRYNLNTEATRSFASLVVYCEQKKRWKKLKSLKKHLPGFEPKTLSLPLDTQSLPLDKEGGRCQNFELNINQPTK